MLDVLARAKVDEFCAYLKDADILLHPNESAERKSRNRGYNFAFAEGLLERIGGTISGVDYEVAAPVNEVPHRLALGRLVWREKFADRWIKRVVLRFKPAPSSENGFTLSGAILLYNHGNLGVDSSFAISQFPKWAQICHDAGMIISRNVGSKWRSSEKPILSPPFVLTRPVRYASADRLIAEQRLRVFAPRDTEDALNEGRRVIFTMFSIVDQF